MFKTPSSLSACGIYLSKGSLDLALVSLQKGLPKIERAFQTTPDVKRLDIEGLNAETILASGLSGSEILVRPLEIKLTKKKDVDAVFEFQAEPLLPFPPENAIMDRIWLSVNKESTFLTLLAVKKDHLQTHLDKLSEREIIPEVVSCAPIALATFSTQFAPSPELPLIVIHLGRSSTICALVKEGKLLASYTIPLGLQQVEETSPDALRLQIERTVYALTKQFREGTVEHLLLCGEGASETVLPNELCGHLKKNLIVPENTEMTRYAIPVGLALGALKGGEGTVNFRKQEFSYPDPWKRLKKPLITFGVLSFAVAFAFYIFGNSYLSYQEDKIKENYVQLLSSLSKTFESVESDYAAKHPSSLDLQDGQAPNLINFSQGDLLSRLELLQKELQSAPDTFPLQPNTPRVSDVLGWLANHPKVAGNRKESEEQEPLIQIESFSYTMVKRPEQGKKQDRYQIKAELEFSTATPKIAREFHDALIAPNEIVDPKGEIKWNANRGKYRTSFYLKDKTIYPQ